MNNNSTANYPFWAFPWAFERNNAGVDQAPFPGFEGLHFPAGQQHFSFADSIFLGPHRYQSFGPGHRHRQNGCRRSTCRPPTTHPASANDVPADAARETSTCGGDQAYRAREGHGERNRHPDPADEFRGQFPPFTTGAPFGSLSSHPWADAFRMYAGQAAAGFWDREEPKDTDIESGFTPPVDIFSTETQYVLHLSIPGAKKEDVGINWDPEKAELNLAGVIYRPGDEQFLKSLSKSERKVGVFERSVRLPPGNTEEKVEIDGDAITAKLEDGILIVTIPKAEKEWTEVKRVDIE